MWPTLPIPTVFQPCSLNISGNVIHSAPGEPVVSTPLALKFVWNVQTFVESGRFPLQTTRTRMSELNAELWEGSHARTRSHMYTRGS